MAHSSQFQLLKERRFLPFFITQFLGAFNDNLFKNALVILISFSGMSVMGMNTDLVINFSAVVFILPFFLFSATAGQLADNHDKAWLMRKIKLLEILIMVLAGLGFYLQQVELLLLVLFLMGTQSAFFGPLKYGYIPAVLQREELVGGNGLTDMGTFLAILIGMMVGAQLILFDAGVIWVSLLAILIAVLGYFSARAIPEQPLKHEKAAINYNLFTSTWQIISYTRKHRDVFLAVIGISWFWFFGSIILTQIPNYTRLILGANEDVYILLMAVFSISVGIGSLLCEKLSGGRVEIGLVPLGSIGLTVFTLSLYFTSEMVTPGSELQTMGQFLTRPYAWALLIDLFFIGFSSGLYIVPLYAFIQDRTEESHISRVIAGNNILNALFMVVAGIAAMLMLGNGLSIPEVFLITALMNLAVVAFIYSQVTEFLWRFIVWLLMHTIYRVKTKNMQMIPREGAAVLVCNHVSFIDALIIAGYVQRPVRFVMDSRIFQSKLLGPIFRMAKTIPIAPKKQEPEIYEQAFEHIAHTLERGELLCIFPEGQITHDGEINEFKPGIEKIIARSPVPVIPMALSGVWGSVFSRKFGKAMSRLPRLPLPKISLTVGDAVAAENVSANGLQSVVTELRGERR